MPLYDYRCGRCHHVFELKQTFNDDPVAACPQCQGEAQRLFRPVPIIFKGSGWYVNDHGKGRAASRSTRWWRFTMTARSPSGWTAPTASAPGGGPDPSPDDLSRLREKGSPEGLGPSLPSPAPIQCWTTLRSAGAGHALPGVWGCPPDSIPTPFLSRKGVGGWSKKVLQHPVS